MSTVRNTNRLSLTSGACGLALLVGCATAPPNSQRRERSIDEVEPGSKAEAPTDVFKAGPKQPEARVSEDQRADFDKAVAVYQKLKKNGSLKGSDCDEAASAFRRVFDQYHTMLIARHNEASVYMECGRKQEGARIEEELARQNYAPALSNLGYAAMISGDSAQAESYFTRAVEADQQAGSISARINLAQILREKARRAGASDRERFVKDALTHLRKVLAVDGNNLQAYATMCFIYFDLGLPDAAVLIGTQAIKRAEEIATGKFEDETTAEIVNRDKAAPKGKKGKKDTSSDEGPKSAKEAVGHGTGWTTDMRKNVAVMHNTLGLVALNKKNYKDAIPEFKKAVELDPELYEARLNLAAVSLRFRDYATAEDHFKAVVAAQPRNYEAVIGLGVAQRGARKYEEAEQQYLAAQKIDPSRADSYFNLGLLYQEYKGSERPTLEKAQGYYREFLSRSSSSSASTRLRHDAEKRIKDIDDLFVALAEAAKLQREAEEIQRKSEEQQKKMEEEMKRQDDAGKKGVTPPAETPAPAAPTGPASQTSPNAPPPGPGAPPPSSVPTLN
jgi:tetratricopeptide (TPR) repeat protein